MSDSSAPRVVSTAVAKADDVEALQQLLNEERHAGISREMELALALADAQVRARADADDSARFRSRSSQQIAAYEHSVQQLLACIAICRQQEQQLRISSGRTIARLSNELERSTRPLMKAAERARHEEQVQAEVQQRLCSALHATHNEQLRAEREMKELELRHVTDLKRAQREVDQRDADVSAQKVALERVIQAAHLAEENHASQIVLMEKQAEAIRAEGMLALHRLEEVVSDWRRRVDVLFVEHGSAVVHLHYQIVRLHYNEAASTLARHRFYATESLLQEEIVRREAAEQQAAQLTQELQGAKREIQRLRAEQQWMDKQRMMHIGYDAAFLYSFVNDQLPATALRQCGAAVENEE